ncbi:MAG: RNA 2',3'-cyclic phosphodiesterase [Candidatus Nanohaloarchaea archaeon]
MSYFISLDVTDEDVKDALVNFGERVSAFGTATPVSRENLHITLLFLGEFDGDERHRSRDTFIDVSSNMNVGKFTCTIEDVGVFPHMNFIEVVWAGAEPEVKLRNMHVKYSEHLNGVNDHEFTPHVSVARVRDIDPEEKANLQAAIRAEPGDFGQFQVNDVRLTRSRLTDDGPVYEDVEVVEL